MTDDPHHELWLDRWQTDRIGFHQSDYNRHLVAHARPVLGEPPRRVLVPLSGKSIDLLWLEEQGYEVVGVEYVEQAVTDFHRENERDYERTRWGEFEAYRSGRVLQAVGDFFAADAATFGRFDAIYERAALVAIAPERRKEYAAKLESLLSDSGSVLLLTVDYPPEEKEGPPYGVPEGVVHDLFADRFEIERLHREDILDERPKWREAGVTRLTQLVFRLTKKG